MSSKWRKGAPGLASKLGDMKSQLEDLQEATREYQTQLAGELFRILENAEVLKDLHEAAEEQAKKKDDG